MMVNMRAQQRSTMMTRGVCSVCQSPHFPSPGDIRADHQNMQGDQLGVVYLGDITALVLG